MNYRVRFIQLSVLGLIGLFLLFYSSNAPSHLNTYRLISKHVNENRNYSLPNSDEAKLSELKFLASNLNRFNSSNVLNGPSDERSVHSAASSMSKRLLQSVIDMATSVINEKENNYKKKFGDQSARIEAEFNSTNPKKKDAPDSATFGNGTSGGAGGSINSAPKLVKNDNSVNNIKKGKINSTNSVISTKELYVSGHLIPNPDVCPELGVNLRLLILITSAPSNEKARMAIRHTWGAITQRRDVALSFVVGVVESKALNDALQEEYRLYGDIIQGAFVDAYSNLTLKTVSMMEWVDNFCPKVPYFLKTDDDMFINIPKLFDVIEKHSSQRRVIFGRLAKRWKPIRKSNSKYYISNSQFARAVYPDFTTGPAYLLTTDLVHDLYQNALNTTYLKLEDVFMTGVVAEALHVKRIHLMEFLNRKIPFNVCQIRKNISIHMVKYYEQFILWEKLHDTRIRCK